MLDMIEHIVVLFLFLLLALSPVLVPLVLPAALFALFVIVRRIWRWTGSWWMAVGGPVVVLLLIFVGPFWHILLQSVIFSFKQYERLQEITATIDKPESVLLQDDSYSVWYHSTLEKYLDGTHLKMLATRGKGDTIYLYRADADPFAETRRCTDAVEQKWQSTDFDAMYSKIYTAEKNGEDVTALKAQRKQLQAQKDMDWSVCAKSRDKAHHNLQNIKQVFDNSADLPPIRYTVRMRHEGCDHRLSLYRSSQMDIVDNAGGKTIAWARSYEGCLSWWQKMFTGAAEYVPKPVKGPGVHDKRAFRDRVLFPYAEGWL